MLAGGRDVESNNLSCSPLAGQNLAMVHIVGTRRIDTLVLVVPIVLVLDIARGLGTVGNRYTPAVRTGWILWGIHSRLVLKPPGNALAVEVVLTLQFSVVGVVANFIKADHARRTLIDRRSPQWLELSDDLEFLFSEAPFVSEARASRVRIVTVLFPTIE